MVSNKYIALAGVALLGLGGLAWVVFGLGGNDTNKTPGQAEVSDVSRSESNSNPTPIPTNVSATKSAIGTAPLTNSTGTVDEDITNIQREIDSLDKNTLKDGDLESIDTGLGSSY